MTSKPIQVEEEKHSYNRECQCENCKDQRLWFAALKKEPEASGNLAHIDPTKEQR